MGAEQRDNVIKIIKKKKHIIQSQQLKLHCFMVNNTHQIVNHYILTISVS